MTIDRRTVRCEMGGGKTWGNGPGCWEEMVEVEEWEGENGERQNLEMTPV